MVGIALDTAVSGAMDGSSEGASRAPMEIAGLFSTEDLRDTTRSKVIQVSCVVGRLAGFGTILKDKTTLKFCPICPRQRNLTGRRMVDSASTG